MWKTFSVNCNELYMIKIKEGEVLEICLTDFKFIWIQNLTGNELASQFKELNPYFDVTLEEAVSEVVDMINNISDKINITIKTDENNIELKLKREKSDFTIQFQFSLEKYSPEVFLKEIMVPLIQTVKHLEDQQKVLCNIIETKDRELQEYQIEKGTISRDDLITEKFDKNSIENKDNNSMMSVFGDSKTFWDTFVSHHGYIEPPTGMIEKLNKKKSIKRKKKIYSSNTSIKKGKGIDYSEKR